MPNWSGYGGVYTRSQSTRCPCPFRPHGAAGSGHRWCLAGSIGVQPEMVVEVSYVEWTPDGLLRHVVYLGEREDKPAIEVRRDRPSSEA